MLTLMIALLVYGLTVGFIISDSAASDAYGRMANGSRISLRSQESAGRAGMYPQAVQRHSEAIQYHAEEMIAAKKTADRTRAEEEMSGYLHFLAEVSTNHILPIRISMHWFKL